MCQILNDFWTQQLGDLPPIAHCFRDVLRTRWVRFHSLPDSKRYVESESEWETLLERQNAVVSQLTTNGSQLELLTTNWSSSKIPGSPCSEICELDLSPTHWRSVSMHEIEGETDPNDYCYWHIFRSTIQWIPNCLDNLFRLVADDRISNVILLDPTDSWLLIPYDGGMDIILDSTDERDLLSSRFATWRSVRSDAL